MRAIILSAFFTLLAVMVFIAFCYLSWTYHRDFSSVLKRAYTASTASESLEYLEEFKEVITERGFDTGNTAFIFNTPLTDLSLKMRNLDSAIERMKTLAAQEESGVHDMAYQTGMAEMIEEMGGPNGLMMQFSVSTLSWKPLFWLGLSIWLFVILAIIGWGYVYYEYM